MGQKRREAFRVGFDRSVKLEFRGAHVTSDAGLLAFRELDDALGLTQQAREALVDTRTGQNTRHGLIAQLRQAVYSRLAGYEDTNDAERPCNNPAMRYVVGDRARSSAAASTSQMGRFETDILTQGGNLQSLMEQPGRWIDQVSQRRPVKATIFDLDSSVSETYGHQEGSAYNGHFGCTCYHPLFCFDQHGDLEGATLRNGNVHAADDWGSVLKPVLARYAGRGIKVFFRGDVLPNGGGFDSETVVSGHPHADSTTIGASLHMTVERSEVRSRTTARHRRFRPRVDSLALGS